AFNCAALGSTLSDTIKWGDGVTDSTVATQVECKETTCDYAVTGKHIYAEEGHYAVTFTVLNPFGVPNPKEGSTSADVADAALTNPVGSPGLSGSEGHSDSYALMSFVDSNASAAPSDFTATINWGDGSSSAGTITTAVGGFTISGDHAYAEEGKYAAAIEVQDDGGSTTVATTQIAVADAPLSATGEGGLRATAGIPGTFVLARFSDVDPFGIASDYTAMIQWGDGTGSMGTVAASLSGGFTVTAGHGYSAPGMYGVSIGI